MQCYTFGRASRVRWLSQWEKSCRKAVETDVDVAKMAISAPPFRQNCGAEIDILAASTSAIYVSGLSVHRRLHPRANVWIRPHLAQYGVKWLADK